MASAERSVEITLSFEDGDEKVITIDEAQDLYNALGDIPGIDRHKAVEPRGIAGGGILRGQGTLTQVGENIYEKLTQQFAPGPGTPTPSGRPTVWVGDTA